MKRGTAIYTKENYKMYTNFLATLKVPHIITRSNYTIRITCSFFDVYFYQNEQSKKAFSVANCIKSDVKKSEANGHIRPDISRHDLRYFYFNKTEVLRKTIGRDVFNIDIKSAYLNVLNNAGVLSEKTYAMASAAPKPVRLACVGMLAARKDVFSYDDAGDVSHSKIVLPTENWFFYCVQIVGDIMMNISRLVGSSFLFFWVDGAFFLGEENVIKVREYLDGLNYKYSFDVCRNFNLVENANHSYISYQKCEKFTKLSMPKPNSEVIDIFLKHLKILK